MFYEILIAVLAVGCYLAGADYIDRHLITFFPEVGQDAIREQEVSRPGEKEELKKAA